MPTEDEKPDWRVTVPVKGSVWGLKSRHGTRSIQTGCCCNWSSLGSLANVDDVGIEFAQGATELHRLAATLWGLFRATSQSDIEVYLMSQTPEEYVRYRGQPNRTQ